ncbi:MAG: RHS repeat-associated core domain-containing protein [Ruminococcus sp.]|nr:RHS repeat-associated core domain-containing protein [Ruminococcus sp.]
MNKITYAYDALSQLTRENNKYLNQTITYTYDNGGNITQKTIYPYTTESLSSVTPTQTIVYTYGNSSWKDLLTSYNGQNITYDAIGNPTSYLGYTLAWNGRQLSSLSGNGVTASYKYDADGLRSYKKVGNVETTYQYVGDKLMYEKRGTTEFYYYYNSLGQLAGIKYIQNGTEYMVYAICNMRGDVEDLYWGNGNLVCHYTYDSWGNTISITDINGNEITDTNHIGLMNPFRYRGYYYDSETGFYLTGTRYYDPEIGRFINADGYVSTGQGILGNNMFAYCGNNPVNRADPSGMFWKEIGNWFRNACNSVKTWASNTFGAGSSTSATITKTEVEYLPDPLPITVKTGTKTTQTVSKRGNSSKPVSVYAKRDAEHPIKSSSAGIKLNTAKFTLDISVGLDNIGISGALANGNTTNSFGLKTNLSELKVGFESSSAIKWDNTTETTYTNASVSMWALAAVYILVTTGQPMPSPSYAY